MTNTYITPDMAARDKDYLVRPDPLDPRLTLLSLVIVPPLFVLILAGGLVTAARAQAATPFTNICMKAANFRKA